ncbi:hypothetical protein BD324DRAFT_572648, partial [Kockovaella imperatae]
MPLESCMLVLDNSEYMRNGDYPPTRFRAQAEAVSTIFNSKTESNPESAVGLMTMAGKAPSLLVTPTNDLGKLLSALNKSTIGGLSDFQTAVQIAQLALKHRENKNQKQRIVVFVGSPLEDSQESLVKLGKRLRKNNVLIDVVTVGEEGMENDEKIAAMVEAAGGNDHLVSVPPGPGLLSDIVRQSPILYDADRPGGDAMDGDDFDPSMDPELAMALRMSLQEAEQNAQRQAQAQAGPSTSSAPEPVPQAAGAPAGASSSAPIQVDSTPASRPTTGTNPDAIMEEDEEDEDEMLRRAMALSRGEDVMMGEGGDDDEEDEDEEAAIARAIAMSLEQQEGQQDKEK